MQTKSFMQQMTDGTEIWVNRWMPDSEVDIKGVIQLHHGLAEHSMRYDRLGSVLTENGFVFNAYDFRGHGRTAENAKEKGSGMFGKLADKDGFNRVVEDLNEIIESLKKDFSGKPVFLLGHSFGSFVSQGYIEKYGNNIQGCTLCGTAGPRPALIKTGFILANIVKFFRGGDTIVPLLEQLSFGSYNKKVENPESKNAWISANTDNVQMYDDDIWCGFPLPVSFYCDMMSGLKQIHNPENIKKIPNELPINFIYGMDDPVGDYGKTINQLYKIYEKNGVKKLSIIGYPNDRHEIFNEADNETVENDFLGWVNSLLV